MKWTWLVLVLSIIIIAVCTERVVHWGRESDESSLEWYKDNEEPKEWDPESFTNRREAGSRATIWFTVGLVGGISMFALLVWVARWEAGERDHRDGSRMD